MVLIDIAVVTAVSATKSASAKTVRAFAKWIVDARAQNKRKSTLQSLLFAPEHRLRDLGMDRAHLVKVLQSRHR